MPRQRRQIGLLGSPHRFLGARAALPPSPAGASSLFRPPVWLGTMTTTTTTVPLDGKGTPDGIAPWRGQGVQEYDQGHAVRDRV